MQVLTDGVWQLSGWPPNNVNVYLLGDVLIDSGLAIDRRRVLRQIAARPIAAQRPHARPLRPLRLESCRL